MQDEIITRTAAIERLAIDSIFRQKGTYRRSIVISGFLTEQELIKRFSLTNDTAIDQPNHRYHQHDLIEWIIDNSPQLFLAILSSWGYDLFNGSIMEAATIVKGVIEGVVRLPLPSFFPDWKMDLSKYISWINGSETEVVPLNGTNPSLAIRSIDIPVGMTSVNFQGSNSWRYDCYRLERNQRYCRPLDFAHRPDMSSTLDEQALRLQISFVHPCRYMNIMQWSSETKKSSCWKFGSPVGNCISNYYDTVRSSLTGNGLNGNYTPLLNYGVGEDQISYTVEELEASAVEGKLPLSYTQDESYFYQPPLSCLDELYDYLVTLIGSIYDCHLIKLRSILEQRRQQQLILSSLQPPNRQHLLSLLIGCKEFQKMIQGDETLTPEKLADKISRDWCVNLKVIISVPSFHVSEQGLDKLYDLVITNNYCCSDFVDVVHTTVITYARQFNVDIPDLGYHKTRHIDYYGRIHLQL